MSLTSRSLLDRLKNAATDSPEWRRLHTIYLPLIQYWLRHVPGVSDEADDLAREVLIVRELPAFERRRDGSFRAWPGAKVAEKLGPTESAFVQAKFRILKCLRQEAGELLD